jgi:hypothetical protein
MLGFTVVCVELMIPKVTHFLLVGFKPLAILEQSLIEVLALFDPITCELCSPAPYLLIFFQSEDP